MRSDIKESKLKFGGKVKMIQKIFITLIIVVACILVGALVLNVLLPNAAETIVDAVESSIYKATGISFDFNNNGTAGNENTKEFSGNEAAGDTAKGGVEGFQ